MNCTSPDPGRSAHTVHAHADYKALSVRGEKRNIRWPRSKYLLIFCFKPWCLDSSGSTVKNVVVV